MSRAELRREWIEIVERWAASGLNGAEFCRRNELSAQRFYAWRRRLREAGPDETGGFVPLSFRGAGGDCCGVHVVIGRSVRLELYPGFDQGELLRAVQTLTGLAPC